MLIEKSIENLYKVFAQYQLEGKLHKCPCGCISDEDEQKIYSKPLQKLEADDIGFYSNKAMTTWGDEVHYKYFLPRIIELFHEDRTNSWIDLHTIHNKLSHAEWDNWNELEQEVIIDFVKAHWDNYINHSELEFWISPFEPYLNYLQFSELLDVWKFSQNKIALKNFVEFYYMNGNEIFYGKRSIKVNEIDRREDFLNLVKRDNLKETLEEEYFAIEARNEVYADKISVVLQMIETNLGTRDK